MAASECSCQKTPGVVCRQVCGVEFVRLRFADPGGGVFILSRRRIINLHALCVAAVGEALIAATAVLITYILGARSRTASHSCEAACTRHDSKQREESDSTRR